MPTNTVEQNKQFERRPWLAWLACCVFVLSLLLRLGQGHEMSAGVACELEAAYRLTLGQCPYVDFYLDQVLPVIIWRMLTLAITSLLAPFCGSSPNLVDCFFNINALGLASALSTNFMAVGCFWFCWKILRQLSAPVFNFEMQNLILLSIALGNLAMGFEYGEQQHLFILLFLPYLLTRYMLLEGARVPLRPRLLSAVLAAAACSFSILYLFCVLLFEFVEFISRRKKQVLAESTVIVFLAASFLFWLNIFLLPKLAAGAYFGWILPFKFNALTHDNFSFYGNFVTPERKSFIYAIIFALVIAFGGILRRPFLRPLASMTVIGLMLWMTLVLGLSCDGLIMTFFMTMLLTMETYFAINWLTSRYPRLFKRKKERAATILVIVFTIVVCLFLTSTEAYQKHLVATAAKRLQSTDARSLPDLQQVITDNSDSKSSVMILNGRLRPAVPLLTIAGRRISGYFIGTEVLGTLSNMRLRHYFEPHRATPESLGKAAEASLYQKLSGDIVKEKPLLICVESGEIEEALSLFHVQPTILESYERIGEAQYCSDRSGPREISEVNYNYWVYKLKVKP